MKNIDDISEQEFEQIERFLSGKLSPEEHQAFLDRMESDPQFKEQVNQNRLLLLGIKEAILQEQLSGFHSEMASVKKTNAPVRQMFPKKYWLAAASVILLLSISFFWFMNRSSGNEKLFANYYESDPGLMTTMGVSENYEFDRAMVDYKSGKFDAAIDRWQKLSATATTNDTLNYFLASAHLAKGESAKAIPYFEKTLSIPGSAFANDASWYLALALVKEGKEQEALSVLQGTSHPRKQELLSDLK